MLARFLVLTKTIAAFENDVAVTVVFGCSSTCQNNGAWCFIMTNQNSVDERGKFETYWLTCTRLFPSQRLAEKKEM